MKAPSDGGQKQRTLATEMRISRKPQEPERLGWRRVEPDSHLYLRPTLGE